METTPDGDRIATWEETVARLRALPEQERRWEIFTLSVIWQMDWDCLRTAYFCQGATEAEVDRRREYFDAARAQLQEAFGYTDIL
jgi:hypothetical protein